MKQWLLCLSLGLSMSAMAMTDDSQQCEFLAEGGNPITDTHLGFADGVVSLEDCEEGLFVFSDTASRQRQVGFVDKFGNMMIKPNPDIVFARPFKDGVSIVVSQDTKYGLINPKGKWVLKPTYDGIYDFNNGVAIAVNKNGDDFDHALIDTTGREVIAMQSATIVEFGEEPIERYKVFGVGQDGKEHSALYHKDGTALIPMDGHSISYDGQTGIITVCHEQQGCRYMDKQLNKLNQSTYDADSPFDVLASGDDFVMIKQKGQYGYLNTQGKEVIAPMYDDATRFSHGVAVVRSGDDYFVINQNNQKVSNHYTNITQLKDHDFYIVQQDGKYGVINHAGRQLVPMIYDNIGGHLFADELIEFSQNGQWGLMNLSGQVMIAPQYEQVNYYKDGLMAAVKNGKWGFVDKDNRTVIDFVYDDPLIDEQAFYEWMFAYVVTDGKIAVVKNGKWGVIDVTGEVVVDFVYDDIEYITELQVGAIKDGEEVVIPLID